MQTTHTLIARLTVLGLLVSPAGPLGGWQSNAAAAARRPLPAATPAGTNAAAKPAGAINRAPVDDGGWPRAYTTPTAAKLVLYQPQITSWPDQKHMTLFAAVSYLSKDAPKAALGTIKVETTASVAIAERLVSFSEFTIAEANFPTLPKEQLRDVIAEINASVPREERVIGLDRVLAMVETSDVKPRNDHGVKADPPTIFFSETPAALVIFDGDPIWSPIAGNELKFAANTNWDVFEYPPAQNYFLRMNDEWLVASSVRGPWKRAATLPDSFSKLPDDGNWVEAKAAVSAKNAVIPTPAVFVTTVPAELILLSGAPRYVPVPGTELVWLSNTESDVFRMKPDGPVYFLVAGRWFAAPQLTGPWTFVTPTLPADFQKIPLEHARSRVLASVPGTRQAIEAVLLAQIPQTATVDRKAVKAPEVIYQGEPKFEPIEQTTVARAVNTDKDVLEVGNLYYLCFEGVWFRSTSATGPWEVADAVPKQVYDIPISSPVHNVTYVSVESSDDDTTTFVTEAAYSGMMVAWGCAMWGTGWYYPPYYWGGGYYGYYPTYGYGASYNPWTGAYTRGAAVYGPYGGAGYAARYNPRTGTYSRGAAAYGPGGAVGAAAAWNPRTGTAAQTRQGANVYGSWGSTAVQRGDQWASTSRVTNRATGTTTRATQGSGGGGAITRRGPEGSGGLGKTGSGDIYAGHDGNVYRNEGGSWQKYDNGNWNSVDRPSQGREGTTGRVGEGRAASGNLTAETKNQLNHDKASRGDGAQRTRDSKSVRSGRSSGGFSSGGAGSYRPSGGGFSRGGGGGRRR